MLACHRNEKNLLFIFESQHTFAAAWILLRAQKTVAAAKQQTHFQFAYTSFLLFNGFFVE